MGLEAVKEEIIRNARKQEEALLAEARQKAAEIVKKAEEQAEELRKKSDAEAGRIMEITKKQELASAELEGKKMLLEAKKQLIDQVFDGVQKKIKDLGAKERAAYMNKLLEKSKNDIEVAKVYCSKKDANLPKGVDVEAKDMLGGLIAENRDGTIRVDYSFESMLQSIKESELQSISRILFE